MEVKINANTKTKLDLSFEPIWAYIPITRIFLEKFLVATELALTSISRITLCASELMENAVKYSDENGIRLIIKVNNNVDTISICVLNHTPKEDFKLLVDTISEMNNSNSLEFYLEQMRKSVTSSMQRSFLGLARINHEAKAKITTSYKEEKRTILLEATLTC